MVHQSRRPDTDGPDFSGMYSQAVIQRLRSAGGDQLVAQVLDEVGEGSGVAELEEHGIWLSYRRLRRLLEAAARRLGGPDGLGPSGRGDDPLVVGTSTGYAQELGSPNDLLRAVNGHEAGMSPVCRVQTWQAEQVDESTWRVTTRLIGGWEPYREFCLIGMTMLVNLPAIFGISDVTVGELSCQCRGQDSCVVEIHWDEGDLLRRQLAFSQSRVRVLEQRLASIHQIVAEIVSDHELDTVLDQVVRSAAVAVGVPSFVLALNADISVARRVYRHGISAAGAAGVAQGLLDGSRTVADGELVAEVCSPVRSYGWLAAVGPETVLFVRHQREMLESYARLAAKALDSAVALDVSRRQAATARTLLDLARALAHVTGVDEVAVRLARAVPQVVDCDRTLVVLTDPSSGLSRVAATVGYDEGTDRRLRGMVVPAIFDSISGPELQLSERDTEKDPWLRELMEATGSAARANVPITAEGRPLGVVVAAVRDRPERLMADPSLGEKLDGMAAQAAVALLNAELVDRISHHASHDALTGLPNRMLLEDRVRHGLAQANRQGGLLGLLFIDLDRFKHVNDSLGHDAGDELIQEVSSRLSLLVRAGDTVARTGGDEFVIVLPDLKSAADATVVAAKILEHFESPFRIQAQDLHVTPSIGIALYPQDGEDYRELLQGADSAMYAAKGAGGGRYARSRLG